MIIDLNSLLDIALLTLRITVAIIFISSGLSHARAPADRGKQIGLSKESTFVLGVIEILAPLSIALGIFTQIGATLLIIVMLGAIYKKVFVWETGFYSNEGMGWHYDLLLLCANLVFLAEAGSLVLIG